MPRPFTAWRKRTVILALSLLVSGNLSASGSETEKLRQLKSRIQTIEQNLQQTTRKRSALEKKLEQADRSIAQTNRQLANLNQSLADTRRKISRLQAQKRDILNNSKQHQALLKKQLRAHYLMGRNQSIKLLLNHDDPAGLGRSLVYYDYYNRRRSRILDQLGARFQQLKTLQQQQQQQERQQAKLVAEKNRHVADLQQQRRQQSRLAGQLDVKIKLSKQKLENLEADAARLARLTGELYQAVTLEKLDSATKKPFFRLKGRLAWPVKGSVANTYGSRRGLGELRWRGINIRATRNTPVKTVAGGTVVFANWLRGYGFLIIIDHGHGYMSLYGHNQGLNRQVGEQVNKGDIIARVGQSGGLKSPALYFEIRRNGKPLNPAKWMIAQR